MQDTHLEVTYCGVLAVVGDGSERRPTSSEFSGAFERMADRLHEIEGLVDPGLWGQASDGSIEIGFCLAKSGNAEATSARATAVIADVAAAGGIDVSRCADLAEHALELAANKPQRVVTQAQRSHAFVLNAGQRAAQVVSV